MAALGLLRSLPRQDGGSSSGNFCLNLCLICVCSAISVLVRASGWLSGRLGDWFACGCCACWRAHVLAVPNRADEAQAAAIQCHFYQP